jgi:hypothetical protein
MKKAILTIALLGLGVAAYAGTALGAGSPTTSERGQVRLMSSHRCNLVFGFRGLAPGTHGRLEVVINGTTASVDFVVPRSGVRGFRLHGFIEPTPDPVAVSYRIGVSGMDSILSGTTMAMCDCMPPPPPPPPDTGGGGPRTARPPDLGPTGIRRMRGA